MNTAAATAAADDDLATQNKTLACFSTCSGQRNSESQKIQKTKTLTAISEKSLSLQSVARFLFVCLSPVAFGLIPDTKTRRLQLTYHLKPPPLSPRSQNLQGRRRRPRRLVGKAEKKVLLLLHSKQLRAWLGSYPAPSCWSVCVSAAVDRREGSRQGAPGLGRHQPARLLQQ